jgi:prophage regulatory protein
MRQNPCGKSTLLKVEGGRVAKASSQSASHASDGWAPADRHGHEALLRLPAVIGRVGLRKSAIYEKIRRDEFPRPVPIGRRARAWRASDIEQWIAQRG